MPPTGRRPAPQPRPARPVPVRPPSPTRWPTGCRRGWSGCKPQELNVFAWSAASRTTRHPAPSDPNEPDNTELSAGVPGPGLSHMLNDGLEVEYGVPIRAGDVITSVRTLGGYSEREGRLGLMLFSRTVDTWTNQRHELVKRSAMTLIRY
ncbi:hypothetical protein CGZ93_05235 [Enemella dayhoffiae]|uniref:FAS1-like dehydratase domain-containing protein n=1 Tax=Enemella dayhoffiae TaxID=2016507 RepID=A0A255H8L8_9ACTN|nr:hypothetical protein CGZ93_05235 [Enemella dayhoffiae]